MKRLANPTLALTQSGFSEAQAEALVKTIERTAIGAVDDLRHDLEGWHVHLAMYLLIQIGIVLLVMLLVQAIREPGYRVAADYTVRQPPFVRRPTLAIHSEWAVNLTRFATFQT